MDVMGLQDQKTYTEWEKLRERIAETDTTARKVEELRQERRGKKIMAAAQRAVARVKRAEEKQKEAYEKAKGEALRAEEAKQAEKMPS